MKPILIYSTAPDEDTAKKIATTLLEKNLIACANIIPKMQSVYRWENKIENSTECILILKTFASYFQDIQDAYKSLHPYQVPCLMSIPIDQINDSYLNWMLSQSP